MLCIDGKGRYDIEQRYKLTDTNLPHLYRLNFEVEGDERKDKALDTGYDLVRCSL